VFWSGYTILEKGVQEGGFRDIGGLGASSPRKFLKLRSLKMGYPEF